MHLKRFDHKVFLNFKILLIILLSITSGFIHAEEIIHIKAGEVFKMTNSFSFDSDSNYRLVIKSLTIEDGGKLIIFSNNSDPHIHIKKLIAGNNSNITLRLHGLTVPSARNGANGGRQTVLGKRGKSGEDGKNGKPGQSLRGVFTLGVAEIKSLKIIAMAQNAQNGGRGGSGGEGGPGKYGNKGSENPKIKAVTPIHSGDGGPGGNGGDGGRGGNVGPLYVRWFDFTYPTYTREGKIVPKNSNIDNLKVELVPGAGGKRGHFGAGGPGYPSVNCSHCGMVGVEPITAEAGNPGPNGVPGIEGERGISLGHTIEKIDRKKL
jgi:hypothetical protein